MRIAILGPAYPFRGGIAKHTGMLCRALEKRGHSFRLFSFLKQFPALLFPGHSQFDISQQADQLETVRVFTPWNPFSWVKTARAIKRFQPELALCVWWTPFTGAGYAAVCAMLPGVKKMFLLHNIIPHEKLPLGSFFTKLALYKASGFIVQSSQVEAELKEFMPDAAGKWLRKIPHPIYDFQEYSSPHQSTALEMLGIRESRVLLFFGLVRKYKGLMTLLEAFPRIAGHFQGDIRLLIAGEFYDNPAAYLQAITRSGHSDKITVINRFIPNEEVGRYFAAADVVALPYESASQSGVVPTAYGFGKPVITTSVGGLPEAVIDGSTGLLCPPSDAGALAETVIRFYELNKTVDWKVNIEELQKKFSWEALVEAVESFSENRKPRTENR